MIKQTSNLFNNNFFKFPKYLSLIIGIYCFCFTLPTILLKLSVVVPYFGVVPTSMFFTGTYFVILDVITEVYGYFEAKKALYAGLVTYTIFVLVMEFLININISIPYSHKLEIINNDAYYKIYNNIYLPWVSVVFCTLFFDIFNIRLLSKWKFLLHGKYFILRSILSSSVAITLFSIVTNFFAYYGRIINGETKFYLNVVVISLSAKIVSLIICSFPAFLLSKFLKKAENIDIMHNTNIILFNKDN